MSITRAVSSSLSCHGCRSAIVRSFVSPTTVKRASWTMSDPSCSARRAFTSTIVPRREKNDFLELDDETEIEAYRRTIETQFSNSDQPQIQYPITVNHPTSDSRVEPSGDLTVDATVDSDVDTTAIKNVPWYLRDRVVPIATQVAQLPDLPPNPPPLLEPLLHYISMTAGLDDLLLLDLRHLDPPPALGPKLIMIIGTARSEKHLHVAADRFCRWLRREHSLRANAAGLLGRNELKIKLRRKAKRMKMLANVGGQEPEGNVDDGIRTGWICCTVGKIEAHPEDMHMPGDDVENFVGFREVKPGVNVVVQMFVEEKRAEIDLETLWGGVMRTHEREGKIADKILEDLDSADGDEGEENAESRGQHPPTISPQPAPDPPSPRKPIDPFPGASSTVAPRPQPQATAHDPFSDSPPSPGPPIRPKPSAGDPFPGGPSPTAQWTRPQPSAGDPFPPASDSHTARPRHIRRLHTIGLSRS